MQRMDAVLIVDDNPDLLDAVQALVTEPTTG
jgi:hypothetical protein